MNVNLVEKNEEVLARGAGKQHWYPAKVIEVSSEGDPFLSTCSIIYTGILALSYKTET